MFGATGREPLPRRATNCLSYTQFTVCRRATGYRDSDDIIVARPRETSTAYRFVQWYERSPRVGTSLSESGFAEMDRRFY